MNNYGNNPYLNNPYGYTMQQNTQAVQQQQPQNLSPRMNLTDARSNQMRQIDAIGGRYVHDENEIRPNEVDMNGGISFFPTYDYSKIYAKQWGSNGLINTEVYVLAPKENEPVSKDALQQVMAELAEIKMELKKQGRPYRSNHKPKNVPTEPKGE